MNGKWEPTSLTYPDFADEIRKRVPSVSNERLYHEWCLMLNRNGEIGFAAEFDRIEKRIRKGEPKRLIRDAPGQDNSPEYIRKLLAECGVE